MRRVVASVALVAFFLLSSAAWALNPLDRTWECSEWEVRDVGPAVSTVVEDGCEVQISGAPYTLYSVVQFPCDARYFKEWDVELESRLSRGAIGIAIGNVHSGLIFQVSDRNEAEVLFYRGSQKIQPKIAKKFRNGDKEYTLHLSYDIEEKHCIFRVNGDVIFDLYPDEIPNLPMSSNVQQVAVTTALLKGRRAAAALHKRIQINAR